MAKKFSKKLFTKHSQTLLKGGGGGDGTLFLKPRLTPNTAFFAPNKNKGDSRWSEVSFNGFSIFHALPRSFACQESRSTLLFKQGKIYHFPFILLPSSQCLKKRHLVQTPHFTSSVAACSRNEPCSTSRTSS